MESTYSAVYLKEDSDQEQVDRFFSDFFANILLLSLEFSNNLTNCAARFIFFCSALSAGKVCTFETRFL